MSLVTIKELIEAGLHFGHAAKAWNPMMKPYIYGVRKKVHIIDLKQTARSLVAAVHLVNQVAAQGKKVIFVGTKVQAQSIIKEVAMATNNYYVNERWLGGMLTNLEVVMSRINRMKELEAIDAAGTGYSKKVLASFKRDLKKLHRDLNGVREMTALPDLMVVVDPEHEHIAVKEANICHIPVIALADTNCDPRDINLLIPGNDDAHRAVGLVLGKLKDSILDAQSAWAEQQELLNQQEAADVEGQTEDAVETVPAVEGETDAETASAAGEETPNLEA